MLIKKIIDEDFTNYCKPSMFICMPRCTMKCGKKLCQNNPWLKQPDVEIEIVDIIQRYMENKLTNAIVFAGLEPFDTSVQMMKFISKFRQVSNDDVVIYTGYNKDEISELCLGILKELGGIVIKYGRYIPGQSPHYDEILGVELASDNQYAERL